MNITIRPLVEQDALISYKWRNDPEVFKYTGTRYTNEITLEMEYEWIRKVTSDPSDYRCAILVDGVYVGNIYLTGINNAEATYHIFIGNREYWGKGVAKEASRQIIDSGFNKLGLTRINLKVRVENTAAHRLYLSLGFQEERIDSEYIYMALTSQPIVSVKCMVYNQKAYLRECLDGIVSQQTTFKFEAIVHDDASTDGSADIIKEYAQKYPDVIKPVFEVENQYSKHDGSLTRIMRRHLNGKYIAICEGDDYWTDPLKLQKQVDYLEAHPECSMCCSDGIVQTNDSTLDWARYSSDRKIPTEDVIKEGGLFLHTASLIFRRELMTPPSPPCHKNW